MTTANEKGDIIIKDVWHYNMHEELQIISKLAEKYNYISMVWKI